MFCFVFLKLFFCTNEPMNTHTHTQKEESMLDFKLQTERATLVSMVGNCRILPPLQIGYVVEQLFLSFVCSFKLWFNRRTILLSSNSLKESDSSVCFFFTSKQLHTIDFSVGATAGCCTLPDSAARPSTSEI